MGSFGISREFEFKVGNHGEPCTKSCVAREEECFYREEKEVERIERVNRINKEPMASHWLSSCQGRRVFLLPIGSAFSQDMKALFLQGFGVSQLYLIEVSVYTFFFPDVLFHTFSVIHLSQKSFSSLKSMFQPGPLYHLKLGVFFKTHLGYWQNSVP